MDPIDMELLSSAPLAALVPYGTFEKDIPTVDRIRKQPPSPILESLSGEGLNPERNLI